MKIRIMVLSCLISVVVLSMGYEGPRTPSTAFGNPAYSRAVSKADKPSLKIGVVNVQKIFQDCKRTARYRQEAVAERDKVFVELKKLTAEVEADQAGLKALKAGSSDHLASMKEIIDKQAKLQAQQEFHRRQMALKQRTMVERLYKDILRETGEIAKQEGLDLVFEKSEPELSALSSKELDEAISAHKLLYSGGCFDITGEVMARLDAK